MALPAQPAYYPPPTMKMLYFSLSLMLLLLSATAYLAFQARDEAVKANAKMDLITRQQQAVAGQQSAEVQLPPGVETPAPAPAPAASTKPAPEVSSAPPSTAAPSASSSSSTSRPAGSPTSAPPPAAAKAADAPPASLAAPEAARPASTLAINEPPPPVAAPSLTPAQRLVKGAPSIGKVKEFLPDQGFVVLSVGTKQGINQGSVFDLRREASIVGRIKVTSADEEEAVADLDYKSVPGGITIKPGDEIVTVMQPQR